MVLERYFAALDGPEPRSALGLVSDDVRFSTLFSVDSSSANRQSLGGRDALAAYIDQRGTPGWRHHVLGVDVDGAVELAWGETRYADDSVAGTFVIAARLDGDGRIDRLICGRTPALTLAAAGTSGSSP
jgi:hypothetical protein